MNQCCTGGTFKSFKVLNKLYFHEKNLQKFKTKKNRENDAVSYCLAFNNFNFTRKSCKNSKHINFVKMFGYYQLIKTLESTFTSLKRSRVTILNSRFNALVLNIFQLLFFVSTFPLKIQ